VLINVRYLVISDSLLFCANLRSAHDFCSRGLKRFPQDKSLVDLLSKIEYAARSLLENPELKVEDYSDKGLVRREIYPWNNHEPERCSEDQLRILNNTLRECAPKLEVRATDLPNLRSEDSQSSIKQLGLFAKEDLSPGDLILDEKSLLTATSKLNDTLCDACSAILAPDSLEVTSCSECAEVIFCSTECHDRAWSEYHRAICGADITSLAKDAPPKEAVGSLYTLLLFRTLAMALTQNKHPLDLDDVKYIWGDFEAPMQSTLTLPFSFNAHILLPLNFLELALANIESDSGNDDDDDGDDNDDKNKSASPPYTIFTLPWNAVWVFNTLYAKFRGTASARQAPDGRPEAGAVHPLWCLANHSCDPNVRWDWTGGRMRFWVREKRIVWRGKEEEEEETESNERKAGIEKGEEVLGHYCDVDLGVKDRREWAEGALGGICTCERCLWEAALQEKSSEDENAP
jgi:SET domain/MYND finger